MTLSDKRTQDETLDDRFIANTEFLGSRSSVTAQIPLFEPYLDSSDTEVKVKDRLVCPSGGQSYKHSLLFDQHLNMLKEN